MAFLGATSMFVVVFTLSPHGENTALVLLVMTLIVVVTLVTAVIFNQRVLRRFIAENSAAIGMLARGEHQRAKDTFWLWAERTNLPIVNAVARHNLGATLIRQGKHDHAIDVYLNNEQHFPKGLEQAALSPVSAVDLALAYALHGNVEQAEAWMKQADGRSESRTMPSYPGNKAFSRAVIECRAGRPAEAARLLDERWSEYEAILTGDNLRSLRVIRAFAQANADVRNAGVAEKTLADLRPSYRGELDYLGVAWPEMAAFLAAHQLATT